MMNLFSFSWGAPEYCLIFITVPVVGALLLWAVRKRSLVLVHLVHSKYRSLLVKNYSALRYRLKTVLMCSAVFFLCVAFLKPQWEKKERAYMQEGRDVLIACDISRSMLAQDCAPSRLEYAKSKIRTLLGMLSTDRVGLLLFAGSPSMQCPLTADFSAFTMFLDAVDAQTISAGTTSLAAVIKLALATFKTMEGKKSKLLVIFTDGEDFSGNLLALKKEAAAQGVTIFTIGVGTAEGAPIPVVSADGRQSGHIRDDRGKVVITRLNEQLLADIARETGAEYIHGTADSSDMKRLVKLVHRFEKEKYENKKLATVEQQYPYPLAVSFFCCAVEWLL